MKPWLILFAALILFVALIYLGAAARHSERHGATMILARVLAGRHPHGRAVRIDPREPASRWKLMTNRQRAARTWLALLTFAAWCTGMITDTRMTEIASLIAVGCLAVSGLVRGSRRVAERKHRRTRVVPAAAGHAQIFGMHPGNLARDLWVRHDLDRAQPGELIAAVKRIPDHWHPSPRNREAVEALWQARLPVAEIRLRWLLDQHPARLELYCASQPPRVVPLADHLAAIDALPQGQYFFGMASNSEQIGWNATDEDPMLAVAGTTKRGKTNLNNAIVGQGLRRGNELFTVIDAKGHSLTHFTGVPGFTLHNDPSDVAGMAALIHTFRTDMDADIDAQRDGEPGDGMHRTLLIEEANKFFELHKGWWAAARGRDEYEDAGKLERDNPVVRDVRAILYTGAQFNYRVIVDGQDLKDAVLYDARSSFGTQVLFNTKSQWGYFVKTGPAPDEPQQRGRAWFVQYGVPTLFQIVIADPSGGAANEQAWRGFALNGRIPDAEPPSAPRWNVPHFGPRRPRNVPVYPELPAAPEPAAIDGPPVLFGVPAAAAYLGMTEVAFKQARLRHPIDGEMRSPDGKLPAWHRDSLSLWRYGTAWIPRDGGHVSTNRKPLRRRKTGASK